MRQRLLVTHNGTRAHVRNGAGCSCGRRKAPEAPTAARSAPAATRSGRRPDDFTFARRTVLAGDPGESVLDGVSNPRSVSPVGENGGGRFAFAHRGVLLD